jgi:hypothetical protein
MDNTLGLGLLLLLLGWALLVAAAAAVPDMLCLPVGFGTKLR